MNILDKEKAITLMCEFIKSQQNIESITKVKSNAFCDNVFNTHITVNEFGNYYIIKKKFSENNVKLYKESMDQSYLSFTHDKVNYNLYVDFSLDTFTEIDKKIDIPYKIFGFSKNKTIQYKALIPLKYYILKIGHYCFNIDEEEYNFIMKTYDTVIELHNKEKESNKLLNLQKDNNSSITQLLKQFNI